MFTFLILLSLTSVHSLDFLAALDSVNVTCPEQCPLFSNEWAKIDKAFKRNGKQHVETMVSYLLLSSSLFSTYVFHSSLPYFYY